jgi:Nucleoside 2-deoxyribosyltransferase like
VEAPEKYLGSASSLFLAGGITGCPDWQADVVRSLRGRSLAVLNPRRRLFSVGDCSAADAQIRWEHEHLRRADAILFWFSEGPSAQPIAMYELGAAAAADRPIAVGTHPAYIRRLDVQLQLELARPAVRVHSDLGSTVAAALELLAWS